MGYSQKQCAFTSVIAKNIKLKCPYGEITRIVPKGIGINMNGIHIRDGCISSPRFSNGKCSDLVLKDKVREYFRDNCHGKVEC